MKNNYYNKFGGIKFENNEKEINDKINKLTKEMLKLEREYNINITVMTSWKYHEPSRLCDIDTETIINNLLSKDRILEVMNFYVNYKNDKWFFDDGKKLLYTVVEDLKNDFENILTLENEIIKICNNTVKDIDDSYGLNMVCGLDKEVVLD